MAGQQNHRNDYLFRTITLAVIILLALSFSFSSAATSSGDDYPPYLDLILNLLKTTGLVVAGAAGLIGIFADYKDKDGNLRRSGIVAISVIISSTMISVAAQNIENYTKARSDDRAKVKTERILSDVSRVLDPLPGLEIYAEISLDISDDLFKSYRERIEHEARSLELHPTRNEFGYPVANIAPYVAPLYVNEDMSLHTIEINEGSSLYPNSETERAAYEAVRYFRVILRVESDLRQVKKLGGDLKSLTYTKFHDDNATIVYNTFDEKQRIKFPLNLNATARSEWPVIQYNIAEKRFSVRIDRLKSDPEDWEGSNIPHSLLDLYGKTIDIELDRFKNDSKVVVFKDKLIMKNLQKKFRLQRLVLFFKNGRNLYVSPSKKQKVFGGRPYYHFVFPTKIEGRTEAIAE